MQVYIFIVAVVSVLFLLSIINTKLEKNVFLLLFLGVTLIFFAANKGLDVGTDTFNYYQNFQFIETDKYQRTYYGMQFVWYLFTLIIYKLFNYDIYMYICYSIIVMFFSCFIYKCSKHYLLSILLFLLLYFYFQSFNVMRQYLAISFVAYGYTFLCNGNKSKFHLALLLASCFHFSAIILLPLSFLCKMRLTNRIVVSLVILSFIIGVLFSSQTKQIITLFSGLSFLNEGVTGYLDNYGGQRNIYSNLLLNATFIFSFFFSKNKSDLFLLLYFIYIILSNLFGAGGQANRMFYYFQIALIIVIPNVWKEINVSWQKRLYLLWILLYSYSVWYFTLNANAGDLFPYSFR